MGPLSKSWNIGREGVRIPPSEEFEQLVTLINYEDIYVGDHTAGLNRKGQMINLGGIAKGYAGDVAAKIYKENGCQAAKITWAGMLLL